MVAWIIKSSPARARALYRSPAQSGQALTEFAVVVPLLLLLLLGTIAFGHLIYSRMIVMQASNRAARLGAILYGDSRVSPQEARSRTLAAAESVLAAGLPGNGWEVTIDKGGDDLKVTVHYQYEVFIPLMEPFLGESVDLRHQSTYRIERDTT